MSKNKSEQKKDPDKNENSDDVPMPLTSHLGELRKRLVRIIIVILVVFVGTTVVEMELDQPILSAFRAPLDARNVPLVFLELTEPFSHIYGSVYMLQFFYHSPTCLVKSGCLSGRHFFQKNATQSGPLFYFHIHFLSAEAFSVIL
jgi:Sec-independent protein secretion pathway component TatC